MLIKGKDGKSHEGIPKYEIVLGWTEEIIQEN